jgi:hypothetical protein
VSPIVAREVNRQAAAFSATGAGDRVAIGWTLGSGETILVLPPGNTFEIVQRRDRETVSEQLSGRHA